jgi:hypothetical protein
MKFPHCFLRLGSSAVVVVNDGRAAGRMQLALLLS